jgi:hypothetical protein
VARLSDALIADELTTPLVARLHDASSAATDLLARASRQPAPDPTPRPEPDPSPDPAPARFDRAAAEAHLESLRERLRAEANLDLTWQFEELPDAES